MSFNDIEGSGIRASSQTKPMSGVS